MGNAYERAGCTDDEQSREDDAVKIVKKIVTLAVVGLPEEAGEAVLTLTEEGVRAWLRHRRDVAQTAEQARDRVQELAQESDREREVVGLLRAAREKYDLLERHCAEQTAHFAELGARLAKREAALERQQEHAREHWIETELVAAARGQARHLRFACGLAEDLGSTPRALCLAIRRHIVSQTIAHADFATALLEEFVDAEDQEGSL